MLYSQTLTNMVFMNKPGRKPEYTDQKHLKIREYVARWRLRHSIKQQQLRQTEKALLTAFICWLLLDMVFATIAVVYAPQFIAKGTAGEITIGPWFYGANYGDYDANGDGIYYLLGGYHLPTYNSFQLGVYDRVGGTSTIYNNTNLEGGGFWFDNDAVNVYANDRYGNFTRFNKLTHVFVDYLNPMGWAPGHSDALSCSVHPTEAAVYGITIDYDDPLHVWRYSPATGLFTDYGVLAGFPPAAQYSQGTFIHEDLMWWLAKNPGYLVAWNTTSHLLYNFWQIGYDISYPTRFVDVLVFDHARHVIWLIEYGKGLLVKFDMETETASNYDVSDYSYGGTALSSLSVIGNYVVWSDYHNTWYVYNPDLGEPSDSSVWSIAASKSSATAFIAGTGNTEASPTDTIYVAEIDSGLFSATQQSLTLDLTYTMPYATDIPTLLGYTLGSSVFVGGLVASLILMAAVMVPIMYLSRGLKGDGAKYVLIIFGLGSMGLCVAMTWFPVWLMALTVLVVGALWALAARGSL